MKEGIVDDPIYFPHPLHVLITKVENELLLGDTESNNPWKMYRVDRRHGGEVFHHLKIVH